MQLDRPLTLGKALGVLAALLGLVVAYLLGAGSGTGDAVAAPAAAAAPTASGLAADARTLTMTGTGEATVVPDQMAFSLTVVLERSDLDSAFAAASSTLEGVLRAVAAQGVDRKDVQTAGLSMTPVYDYPSYGPPVLRGYRVTQRATVLVRSLKDAGDVVGAAIARGGNDVRVGSLHLQVGDPEAALATAREQAVEQARAKAEQYAKATGQQLGAVLTLRETRSANPRRVPLAQAGYAARDLEGLLDSATSLPVRAGQDTTTVHVQVVWEFGAAAQ